MKIILLDNLCGSDKKYFEFLLIKQTSLYQLNVLINLKL